MKHMKTNTISIGLPDGEVVPFPFVLCSQEMLLILSSYLISLYPVIPAKEMVSSAGYMHRGINQIDMISELQNYMRLSYHAQLSIGENNFGALISEVAHAFLFSVEIMSSRFRT